ncbi:MAG: hypothetical protein KBE72_08735, partial [Syntrophaceae bacterium]|nr:hypothetical protein [Syntrophaceae bacterium]
LPAFCRPLLHPFLLRLKFVFAAEVCSRFFETWRPGIFPGSLRPRETSAARKQAKPAEETKNRR